MPTMRVITGCSLAVGHHQLTTAGVRRRNCQMNVRLSGGRREDRSHPFSHQDAAVTVRWGGPPCGTTPPRPGRGRFIRQSRCSIVIGSWRTRTPVAWKTALATAAETQTAPSSGDVLGQERGVAVADLDGFRWHAEHLGGDPARAPRAARCSGRARARCAAAAHRVHPEPVCELIHRRLDREHLLAGPGSMEGKGGTDVHRHSAHWKSLTWSMAH